MRCPKCGFEQPDGGIECIRCGIVFAKYAPKKKPAPEETPSPVSPSVKEKHATDNGFNLERLLFEVNPEVNVVYLTGRALVFLVILAWGMKFMFTPMKTNYAGESFMHLINLPFHEAGHILFRIFGRFMSVLGGSLMQLIVPLICLTTFLLKTKDTFAASVSLWWLAESLMDLAIVSRIFRTFSGNLNPGSLNLCC